MESLVLPARRGRNDDPETTPERASSPIRGSDRHACEVCAWLHARLPTFDPRDASPDSHEENEFADPIRAWVLQARHAEPPELWKRILNTMCLYEGTPFNIYGQKFVRFPLRGMRPLRTRATRDSYVELVGDPERWTGFNTERWGDDEVINGCAFHVTKIEYLVSPNDSMYGFLSGGILVDRGLRYGRCTHGGHNGVNFYSYLHPRNFVGGHVALALRAVDATRLRRGSRGRHCVKGVAGSLCDKVEATHVIFPLDTVPRTVLMT